MSDVDSREPRIIANVGQIWRDAFREFNAVPGSDDEAVLVAATKVFARAVVRGQLPALGARREDVRGIEFPEALRDMISLSEDAMERWADDAEQVYGWPLTPSRNAMQPVVDWIRSVRQDDLRVYSKLPRMNFTAMNQSQERWHAALAKKGGAIDAPNLASCPILHRYDDGWSWVWVQTDDERDAEGDAMGHCVGQGSYDRLGRGGAIVSLRDPAGRPHVTVEIGGVRRMQAQGRGNTPPAAKYAERIAEVTLRVGASVTKHGEPRWLDDAGAMSIVAEHIALNVRRTGGNPRMSIILPIDPEAGRELFARAMGGV